MTLHHTMVLHNAKELNSWHLEKRLRVK